MMIRKEKILHQQNVIFDHFALTERIMAILGKIAKNHTLLMQFFVFLIIIT